jgi:hypothetical protein
VVTIQMAHTGVQALFLDLEVVAFKHASPSRCQKCQRNVHRTDSRKVRFLGCLALPQDVL